MSDKREQPMQPIVMADDGVIRFQENKIVEYMLNLCRQTGVLDLNQLAIIDFPQVDREQFAQLIGYSVSGFGDLSYARPETVNKADVEAERIRKATKS